MLYWAYTNNLLPIKNWTNLQFLETLLKSNNDIRLQGYLFYLSGYNNSFTQKVYENVPKMESDGKELTIR